VPSLTLDLPDAALTRLAASLADALGASINQQPDASRWLDVQGAADYLSMTSEAVRKLAQRRQIPFYQPQGRGSRYLFRREELDAWVEQGRVEMFERGWPVAL
jgi:excisionase family DNA binding protein